MALGMGTERQRVRLCVRESCGPKLSSERILSLIAIAHVELFK